MMQDWQFWAALSVVAVTLITLTVSTWRRMHNKSSGAGCHADCGCVKTELVRDVGRPR